MFDVDDDVNKNISINTSQNLKSPLSSFIKINKITSKTKNKKIEDLSNLVLSINKDNLIDTFYNTQQQKIDYDIIIKKILLPYFKIKSRVMKKGMQFKIGEISFKVNGLAPFKKGLVTSKTSVQCNTYYSLETPIKRALLITTTKYDNFDKESLLKDLFSSNDKQLIINKNEIAQLKQYEFYIRNCEPETGVLTPETIISIENKEIMNITKLKIAILKNNIPQFQNPAERRIYEDYILQEYFKPYFLSGVKKYIERGDNLMIEDLEMFILNCYPDNGFISVDTNAMFKFGLNKEKCLEKIHNADNKYAFSLLSMEDRVNHSRQTEIVTRTGLRNLDNILIRGLLTANRLNCKMVLNIF